ncbi:hypothetical protein KAI87_04260 [Myxococcota bacterium]|nr:hypothetical protein [Myxococcota bacterium]
MKATLTILGAAFAMMLLVGCGAEDASYVRAEGELSGRWAIRAIEQSHGCPDLGPLSPVEQGLTEIQMTETGVELLGRNARLPVAYQVDGRVWSRKTETLYGNCQIYADARWFFDAVGEARFSATVEVNYQTEGECEELPAECVVQHRVTGVQR